MESKLNPFPADEMRLRELILHIAARCADWEDFDTAHLDRILFQADFLHFRLHGYPITGQTYRRGIRSPAPRIMRRVLRSMIEAGDLEMREEACGDGWHVRLFPFALREPALRRFDGQEIALVETVVRFYRDQAVDGSHGPDLLDLPWDLAGPREAIPYHLSLVAPLTSFPFPTSPLIDSPAMAG
ncbi:MAG: hypothetical protein JWP91_649 [Fibrobacteres bacterium]|nr:hypothetical protein [Fibrobacterota bacterium]